MEIIIPNEYKVRVTKRIKIPVTIPFVLNGTPRIVGRVMIEGKEHPLYGYKEEVVSQIAVVYVDKESDIYPALTKRFGTDIAYRIV